MVRDATPGPGLGPPPHGLVGREFEVGRAVDLIRQGQSVAVVGQHWSGRTAFLDAVRGALEDSGRDVRLAPASWRWSRQWPASTPLTAPERDALLDQLDLGEVVDLGSSESDVVVVDDIERLAPSSTRTLGALARHAGVPVLLTRLPRRTEPWVGTDLSASSTWVEVHLDPLSFEDLHRLLSERLGDALSPEVTAQVLHESGGLPGLAIAVLDAALARGTVRRTGDLWTGSAGWARELRAMFDLLLEPLTTEQRSAAAVLARSGTLPTDVAGRLLTEEAVAGLYDHGLLRTSTTAGGKQIALDPPGLASHLLAQDDPRLTFAATRASRRAGAEGADDPRLQRVADRVSHADHVQLFGRADHAGTVLHSLAGPELEGRSIRHELAAALDAWRRTHQLPDAVQVLHLTTDDRRGALVIESVLSGTDTSTGRATFAYVEFRYAAARWAIVQGQDPRAVAEDLRASGETDPAVRDALWLLGYLLGVEFGTIPGDYEQELTPYLAGPTFDGPTARVVLAGCHVLAGRYTRATRLLDLDRTTWPQWLDDTAQLLLGLSTFATGDLGATIERGLALRDRGKAELSASSWADGSYVAALGLSTRGWLDDARRHLLSLLSMHHPWTDPLPTRQASRGMLVLLSVLTSQGMLAPGLVESSATTAAEGEALPYSGPTFVHAMKAYADGDLTSAVETLDRSAADLRQRGLVLPAEVTDLTRLLIDRDTPVTETPGTGPWRIGGPYLRALIAAREALRREDPVGVHAAGTRFEDLEIPVEAARCYTLAAELYHRAGEQARAARERAAAAALQNPEIAVLGTRQQHVLSDREREIVDLIARGRSNPEIAAELFLSVRTIEGHIRHIRRKTGATDRASISRLSTHHT